MYYIYIIYIYIYIYNLKENYYYIIRNSEFYDVFDLQAINAKCFLESYNLLIWLY